MTALTSETLAALEKTAHKLVADGRGILAADESPATAGKRLVEISLENTPENRCAFRRVLFASAPRLAQFVSGVILHEESLAQSTADGRPLVQPLVDAGILLGIKLDKGTAPLLGGRDGETETAGLDGLVERARAFAERGCVFAKWRCTYRVGGDGPSQLAVDVNAEILARYAAACQAAGIVPIVEPEVLIDGGHSIEQAAAAGRTVIAAVYARLAAHGVYLPGTLLKPSMVVAGAAAPPPQSAEAYAAAVGKTTALLLAQTVPPAVPGIVFLSGGLSESDATRLLASVNRAAAARFRGGAAWRLTFSFARALQNSAVRAWAGKPENETAAADVLVARASACSAASLGRDVGNGAKSTSLYEEGYTY